MVWYGMILRIIVTIECQISGSSRPVANSATTTVAYPPCNAHAEAKRLEMEASIAAKVPLPDGYGPTYDIDYGYKCDYPKQAAFDIHSQNRNRQNMVCEHIRMHCISMDD
jgi:hypothetical protein